MSSAIKRLRDLITSPVIAEKYGYSIRINEARLLPNEINNIGAFHRQKLKKAVITISVNEQYELNDANCYRIHRLEENLYKEFLPKDYKKENVIMYQWNQNRDYNLKGHFNFYHNIAKNSISRASMSVYLVLITAISCLGSFFANIITWLMGI